MSIKIGIVGPQSSVDKIVKAIVENTMYVEPIPLAYEEFSDAVGILQKCQETLDCILFTGSTPYRYVSHFLHATCPWEYLPQSQLSLVCSLLQAAHTMGWDISRTSFDSYAKKLVYSAYKEIGYERDDTELFFAGFTLTDPSYIELLCQFHKQMYQSGKVACCITGIEKVQMHLQNEKIPCIIIRNATEVIVQQVNKLRLDLQIKKADTKLCAAAIEIVYRGEHSAYSQNILQVYYHKSSVCEQIYMYAQKLGAAVVELSKDCFYLFTTKAAIQNNTEDFKRFDLLSNLLSQDIVQNVFIGVGLGSDAYQSQCNSDTARRHARQSGIDSLYVMQENGRMIGPITVSAKDDERLVDEALYHISAKTGIGIKTLSQLDSILSQYQVRDTTTRALAELYGVNMRSMNRILLKLEQAGYVTVVGKEATAGLGRPGRIMRINLK